MIFRSSKRLYILFVLFTYSLDSRLITNIPVMFIFVLLGEQSVLPKFGPNDRTCTYISKKTQNYLNNEAVGQQNCRIIHHFIFSPKANFELKELE